VTVHTQLPHTNCGGISGQSLFFGEAYVDAVTWKTSDFKRLGTLMSWCSVYGRFELREIDDLLLRFLVLVIM
jgi:hypothetical protein